MKVLVLFASIEEVQENYRRDCQCGRNHGEEALENQELWHLVEVRLPFRYPQHVP